MLPNTPLCWMRLISTQATKNAIPRKIFRNTVMAPIPGRIPTPTGSKKPWNPGLPRPMPMPLSTAVRTTWPTSSVYLLKPRTDFTAIAEPSTTSTTWNRIWTWNSISTSTSSWTSRGVWKTVNIPLVRPRIFSECWWGPSPTCLLIGPMGSRVPISSLVITR